MLQAVDVVHALPEGSARKARRAPQLREMLAAIEIGSRSIRMIAADVGPEGVTVRRHASSQLNLMSALKGDEFDILSENVARRVSRLKRRAFSLPSDRIRVFGTEALRRLVDAGLPPKKLGAEVLSAEMEARFAYHGVMSALGADRICLPHTVIDQGNGSLEIAMSDGTPGGSLEVVSLPLGAHEVASSFAQFARQAGLFEKWLSDRISGLPRPLGNCAEVHILGGTAVRLGWIVARSKGARAFDPRCVEGMRLTVSALRQMAAAVLASSEAEQARYTCEVSPSGARRCDLWSTVANTLALCRLLEALGEETFTIRTTGVRFGILMDSYRRRRGCRVPHTVADKNSH